MTQVETVGRHVRVLPDFQVFLDERQTWVRVERPVVCEFIPFIVETHCYQHDLGRENWNLREKVDVLLLGVEVGGILDFVVFDVALDLVAELALEDGAILRVFVVVFDGQVNTLDVEPDTAVVTQQHIQVVFLILP